jgi:putative acetyltransferase
MGECKCGQAAEALEIIRARAAEEYRQVHRLFKQYTATLPEDLGPEDFADVMAELPGAYAPPGGSLLLARQGGRPVGCVALRRLSKTVGEMRRLYVVPGHRGLGIGRALAVAILDEARAQTYRRVRLDTIAGMNEARALYADLGFVTIPPYRHNPVPGAIFMELVLSRRAGSRAAARGGSSKGRRSVSPARRRPRSRTPRGSGRE